MNVAAPIRNADRIEKVASPLLDLFVMPGFLTADECARIIALMEKRRPSTIADDNGDQYFRTSQTCMLDSSHPDVAALEARIVALTGLNPLHGEPLQGQIYAKDQEFKPHTDYFEPDGPDYYRYCSVSGQRTWTVMIYLNEPEEGGITRFVSIGEDIRPETGKLLAWNNLGPDKQPNFNTLHHGMKVIEGHKYIVTKWFRERPWTPPLPSGTVKKAPNPVPTPPPSGVAASDPQLALARRDWILAVMEKQRHLLAEARSVPRVRNSSPADFLARFYAPGRPVILEGEIDDWPALSRWSPDYLKKKIGGAEIEYQSGRLPNPEFELQKDIHKDRMPFDAFVGMIEAEPGNNAYMTAYNSKENEAALAPLTGDMPPLKNFPMRYPGLFWLGPMGTYTPLHFDLTNNLLAQVRGSKRIILLPPSETQYLYNHRHVFSPVHDIMNEDCLDRYPLARNAFTYEVTLAPGELLYIPIGWWHQVTALDFSITLTFASFLWEEDSHKSFPADRSS